MELVVGLRVGVLHRAACAELNVFTYGGAERLVVRRPGRGERRQVQLDEAPAEARSSPK
jgi:hypothetical protein